MKNIALFIVIGLVSILMQGCHNDYHHERHHGYYCNEEGEHYHSGHHEEHEINVHVQ